jgi:replicative DNA helicase
MTPRDVSLEAEQAVLGAILSDPDSLAEVGDLFRPELFTGHHREVAVELKALAAENLPSDPVLVAQRLEARKAGVPLDLPLVLFRAVGSTANVRRYTEVLESLWAKREARRVMADALRSDRDESGEEFVGRIAEALSAIETRRGTPMRRLAQILFGRLERIEKYQAHPELVPDRWPTGFAGLDAAIGGFFPGQMVTVASRPGVGKTSFVSAIADNLGMRQVPVGWFMLEDYADAVADRAIMRRARIPSTLMRDGARWDRNLWTRASEVLEQRCDWPIFIDDTHGRTIHDITGAMRRAHREHGIRVFILDNLAEVVIDRQDRSEERLDRALGRIAKQYRDAAHALGAAAILVVHLNREIEKRAGSPPRLSDIKNSGEIEDASHVVAMLSRQPEAEELVIDLTKNRQGPPGAQVVLRWDGQFMAVREQEAA